MSNTDATPPATAERGGEELPHLVIPKPAPCKLENVKTETDAMLYVRTESPSRIVASGDGTICVEWAGILDRIEAEISAADVVEWNLWHWGVNGVVQWKTNYETLRSALEAGFLAQL